MTTAKVSLNSSHNSWPSLWKHKIQEDLTWYRYHSLIPPSVNFSFESLKRTSIEGEEKESNKGSRDLNILEKVKQGKGSQTWIDKAETVSKNDNSVMQCNYPLFLSSSNKATSLVAWKQVSKMPTFLRIPAACGYKLPIDRFHMTSWRPYRSIKTIPVGIEHFSHLKTFLCSKKFA